MQIEMSKPNGESQGQSPVMGWAGRCFVCVKCQIDRPILCCLCCHWLPLHPTSPGQMLKVPWGEGMFLPFLQVRGRAAYGAPHLIGHCLWGSSLWLFCGHRGEGLWVRPRGPTWRISTGVGVYCVVHILYSVTEKRLESWDVLVFSSSLFLFGFS